MTTSRRQFLKVATSAAGTALSSTTALGSGGSAAAATTRGYTGNDQSPVKLPEYVPVPKPAVADRLIGAHYFPGWKPGVHYGWKVLKDFPERRPVLGWYDESKPEVTDWEIKWALEHGIGFFLYCWYRNRDNAGKPITVADLHLGHAIHEGLFHARYRDGFRFAIMWENYGTRGMIASLDDLERHMVPFWIEQYFSKPFYLRIDGRPLLCIYHFDSLIKQAGGLEGAQRALTIIRRACAASGVGEPWIWCEHRGTDSAFLKKARDCGFDAAFAYCWPTKERFPAIEQAFDEQLQTMQRWKQYNILPFPPTATVGWDPLPWAGVSPDAPWLTPDRITRWYSRPEQYAMLLRRVKEFADSCPAESLTRRVLLLDNWNEWGEGHYISPSAAGGFGYLQAVRRVFTDRDNLPDYITPDMLGLGPYGNPPA